MRAALQDPTDAGLAQLVALNRLPDRTGTKLLRAAWLALLEDDSLAPHAVAAVERSGALAGEIDARPRILVEDLVSAFGKWRHQPARSLLAQLWNASGELAMRAGHALLAFGDPEALTAVAARLHQAEGGELGLALKAVFTIDPARAWDVLAPRFASPSPRGGILLDATLNLLMRDIWDDGRQHWGRTREWFRADPRWLELCESWRELPPPALRGTWGAAEAQRIVECAAWLRQRAGAT